MFGFKKKENKEKESKREELLSVVDGTLIPIEEVKDPVVFPENDGRRLCGGIYR